VSNDRVAIGLRRATRCGEHPRFGIDSVGFGITPVSDLSGDARREYPRVSAHNHSFSSKSSASFRIAIEFPQLSFQWVTPCDRNDCGAGALTPHRNCLPE
jgi:hypothetical protein